METYFLRLNHQSSRVIDKSLLSTDNLHEVKHWIEPGNSKSGDSTQNSPVVHYINYINPPLAHHAAHFVILLPILDV